MSNTDMRSEIFKQFAEELKGIDKNIVIYVMDEIPKGELAEQNAVLKVIGKKDNRFVALMKRGVYVLGIVLLLIEAVEKVHTYLPKTNDLVNTIISQIDKNNNSDSLAYDSSLQQIVIFKDNWPNDKRKYENEMKFYFHDRNHIEDVFIGSTLTTTSVVNLTDDIYVASSPLS